VTRRASTPSVKGIELMQRRGATRYPLRLVVTFSWKDEVGVVHGSEGQSRDLNGRGIYVQSRLTPPVGSSVEMNVLLPQLAPPKRPVELHAEGRVVRIDLAASESKAAGFAAMNHTVILRDAEGHAIEDQNSWKEFGLDESRHE
jgi:hypothetical protein